MARDFQRSRCYQWERQYVDARHWERSFDSVQDAQAWAEPIWRAERGRVGLAGVSIPDFHPASWGQRRALAHQISHSISLPKWARSKWVVLHELAHLLTPGDGHGPRFVGLLMGLGCRHLDLDVSTLMAGADALRLKYRARTIGSVPHHGLAWHVEKALGEEGPMSVFDLASWLSLGCGVDANPRQVRGASISMLTKRTVEWQRGKLRLVPVPLQDVTIR